MSPKKRCALSWQLAPNAFCVEQKWSKPDRWGTNSTAYKARLAKHVQSTTGQTWTGADKVLLAAWALSRDTAWHNSTYINMPTI